MKQVIFYSKRVAAFALACFVVVFSIGFSSSAATVATDLHADINMNVEIKYTDGTFSQSDPELIGKTPYNVDPEDWAMAAPPVFSNKQISHVRVNTDLTGYQVPSTVIPPDPVHVIKAGTYRFNDVLSLPSAEMEQSINFMCSLNYQGTLIEVGCSSIILQFSGNIPEKWFEVLYRVIDLNPNPGLSLPYNQYVYTTSPYSNHFGWGVEFVDYDNSCQAITIPTDQEVSAEFLEWFSDNTQRYFPIYGCWQFNDVLTIPLDPVSQAIHFTSNIGADGSILAECFAIEMALSDFNGTSTPRGISLKYAVNSLEPNPGFQVPDSYSVYFADSTRNKGWYTDSYGDGIKTVDLGTEPQFVSADFYEWLLANAVPLDQVIPDDPQPETSAPVVGKTVQMRVFYRVELGLAKDAVSSISVNSGTRSGTVWTPLPYTTISSKYATDTSTGSSYIDATIQFTLPADSEVLRVYGTFYTSPFTASNIGEVVGGVQVCEFLYLDPVTDQDPSDKVEVDRIDGVVSDRLDQTGQITDTIEQLQKPSVDVNGSGAPVIGGMVVDPMEQVDPENFGSYTSVIGAIFGSGTILGYFVIAFSMIFISYVIFGKSG